MRYQCVAVTAGAGRKLSECPLVPTSLTVIDVEQDREVVLPASPAGLPETENPESGNPGGIRAIRTVFLGGAK